MEALPSVAMKIAVAIHRLLPFISSTRNDSRGKQSFYNNEAHGVADWRKRADLIRESSIFLNRMIYIYINRSISRSFERNGFPKWKKL